MSLVFNIKRSDDEQYYFTLDAHGKTILKSEMYTQKSACENGIASVQNHAADRDNIEYSTASNGQFYFNIKASNGQIVGTSVMFDSEGACQSAVEQCQQADKANIESA